MSKVKVGDKIRNKISNVTGEVTSFEEKFPSRVWWIVDGTNVETFSPAQNLELLERKTEEETKVENSIDKKLDELKVYTGRETIEALLEGKTLKYGGQPMKLKLEGDKALVDRDSNGKWDTSALTLQRLLEIRFTEVATPQVGDWVKVNTKLGFTSTGLITSVASDRLYGNWDGDKGEMYYLNCDIKSWEILSPEQVSEYKREQAFAKVGRKLNEFRENDFVMIDSLSIIGVVTSKNNTDEVRIHKLNEVAGYTAKPHQLTPIAFVEQQVDLS